MGTIAEAVRRYQEDREYRRQQGLPPVNRLRRLPPRVTPVTVTGVVIPDVRARKVPEAFLGEPSVIAIPIIERSSVVPERAQTNEHANMRLLYLQQQADNLRQQTGLQRRRRRFSSQNCTIS